MKESHARADPVSDATQSTLLPNFDTMAAVDTLTKTGIGRAPASAIVEVVRDAQRELATESSLLSTKAELKADIATSKAELKAEMASQFSQLYRYLLVGAGVCITSLAGILGLMMTFMGGSGF